jgi:hypothetical protein
MPRRVVAVALVFAFLVVSACSDNSKDGGVATPPGSATASAAAPSPDARTPRPHRDYALTVEAAREDGFDATIDVLAGDTIAITVVDRSQTWSPDPAREPVDASGAPALFVRPGSVAAAPLGMLVARVGDGPWSAVGFGERLTADRDGRLILAINDVPGAYADNNGRIDVAIGVSPP